MTSTPKHTPGPWEVYTDTADPQHPYILQGGNQRPSKVIAILFDDDQHTRPYNAAVLAASADLLDALRSIETRASCAPNDDPDAAERELTIIMHTARAAIRKATPAE